MIFVYNFKLWSEFLGYYYLYLEIITIFEFNVSVKFLIEHINVYFLMGKKTYTNIYINDKNYIPRYRNLFLQNVCTILRSRANF